MKILFISNIPSPYRIDFFNELGRRCELTVAFEGEKATDRDSKWESDEMMFFTSVFMNGIRFRPDAFLCFNVIKILKKNWDVIILGGYSTPTNMLAIEYLRLYHIPFYIEADGGLISKDNILMYKIKRHFIASASGWFSSGKLTTKYLINYGAVGEKCYFYPFTSMKEKDFIDAVEIRKKDKIILRSKLKLQEEKIVLMIGEIKKEKKNIINRIIGGIEEKDIGFYFIKNEGKYNICDEEKKFKHLHFVRVKKEDKLSEYYAAADLLILFSESAEWSNVRVEAKMFGLPIIALKNSVLEKSKNDIDIEEDHTNCISDLTIMLNELEYYFEEENRMYSSGRKNLEEIRSDTIENEIYENIKFLGNEVRPIIRNCAKSYLGIKEEKMVLAVGQYIYRKGFDLLLKAASLLDDNVGIYIVGGKPTDEYMHMKNNLKLNNVHFVEFRTKSELADYYRAADIFVHPTREDIWGLVINEALSYFLPVITTNRCVAGMELIENTVNGLIIQSDDFNAIVDSFKVNFDNIRLIKACLSIEKRYSIEKMALNHLTTLEEQLDLLKKSI